MQKLQAFIIGSICLFCAGFILYYIRPSAGWYVVPVFILLVSGAVFSFIYYYIDSKVAGIAAITVASFFTMNYFAGFEVLNTILLLSFIMGIVLFPRE